MQSGILKTNLFLIGTAKCGTNSIFDLLASHPDIIAGRKKEINHFVDQNALKEKELEKYHSLFDPEKALFYLDASDEYSTSEKNEEICHRIHRYNPSSKFLCIIRNPIDRIESQHWHDYNRGWTKIRNINEAIEKRPYLDHSRFYSNLKAYLNLFGEKKLLILFIDDLISDPQNIRKQLADFLQINEDAFVSSIPKSNTSGEYHWIHHKYDRVFINKGTKFLLEILPNTWLKVIKRIVVSTQNRLSEKPKLNDVQVKKIKEALRSEIMKIENLTGRDLKDWYI